jgi:hypothetical protein
MRRAFLGAALIVGGIAAFIAASRQVPGTECAREVTEPGDHTCLQSFVTGWNRTTYDLGRIGAWALVIFGAVPSWSDSSRIGEHSVTLALDFSDTFDLTAVGTLGLALVTVGSLLLAGRALKQTKKRSSSRVARSKKLIARSWFRPRCRVR